MNREISSAENSVDSDQLASTEASRSESTLFPIQSENVFLQLDIAIEVSGNPKRIKCINLINSARVYSLFAIDNFFLVC